MPDGSIILTHTRARHHVSLSIGCEVTRPERGLASGCPFCEIGRARQTDELNAIAHAQAGATASSKAALAKNSDGTRAIPQRESKAPEVRARRLGWYRTWTKCRAFMGTALA
jgi:hypothetical protein